MRVIAGSYRGRTLLAPKGEGTRPTTDRVRESLFSALTSLCGPELGGGAVLDPFAGSGALGIEALSRGCTRATFVELDRAAVRIVEENVASVNARSVSKVILGDAVDLACRGRLEGGPFSLLLLDPPYRLAWCDIEGLTSALVDADLLVDGAVITYEYARGTVAEWPGGFDLVRRKRYGTTGIDIVIYERGAGAS